MTGTETSTGLASPIDAELVAVVRGFTRFSTTVLEVLEEPARHAYSMTEARVIFELAQHGTGRSRSAAPPQGASDVAPRVEVV